MCGAAERLLCLSSDVVVLCRRGSTQGTWDYDIDRAFTLWTFGLAVLLNLNLAVSAR